MSDRDFLSREMPSEGTKSRSLATPKVHMPAVSQHQEETH
jgi:hypothetical protein